MTRASRVSRPAFFSDGRLASTSMALRARATPRRRAPAWPVMPPPWIRAITSKRPTRSVLTNGSLTTCWCSLLGKYDSRGASVDGPLTGARNQPDARDGLLAATGRVGRSDGGRTRRGVLGGHALRGVGDALLVDLEGLLGLGALGGGRRAGGVSHECSSLWWSVCRSVCRESC